MQSVKKTITPNNFISMIKKKKKGYRVLIEDRIKLKYREYGIQNHDEFINFINPSDGDLWDIIIPGYNYKIKQQEYIIKNIFGYIWMEDGNYKIIADLGLPNFSHERLNNDLNIYLKNYKNHNSHLNPKLINF